MAYEVTPAYLEDEDEDGTEQEGFVQEGTNASGLITAGGEAAPTKVEAPTAGAGVTDINKYLDANKAKIQQLGQDVSGVVRGDIETARTGLAGAGDQFTTDVAGGTVNQDEEFFNRAKGSLTDQANYQTGQAGSFLGNAEDVERFKNLYGAEYGGPQDIVSQDYYEPAYTDAQKAIRTKGLVEDSTGRQELIARARQSDSGRYSKGALTLDEALLAGDQTALSQVQAASSESDIQDRLTALQEMAAQQVLTGQETTADTRAAMREEFDLSREEGELDTYAEEVKAQAQADYAAKLDEIQKQYAGEYAELGSGYGADEASYYDQSRVDQINKYNVTSAEDYARLQALEELTGIKGTMSQFADKAGGASEFLDPNAAFDEEKYTSAVSGRREQIAEAERTQAAYLAEQARQQAEAEARMEEEAKTQTATAIGATVGGVAGSFFGPVGTGVGIIVGGFIGSLFCMDPDTLVKMNNGDLKALKDLDLSEHLFEGGAIYTISRHSNTHTMFKYNGVLVTGSHAVKEGGIWKRVIDSEKAVLTDHVCKEVISLSCENHIMICNDTIFADYDEIDNAQGLTDPQCLRVLNQEELVHV